MPRRPTCLCGSCAKCKHRERAKAHYWRNRDRVCETARRSRQRRLEAVREYDRSRGYRPGAPEKKAARNAVTHALQDGTLKREPCEVCGERAQAHHDDYAKPLEVRWLCARHHGEVHRREEAA